MFINLVGFGELEDLQNYFDLGPVWLENTKPDNPAKTLKCERFKLL